MTDDRKTKTMLPFPTPPQPAWGRIHILYIIIIRCLLLYTDMLLQADMILQTNKYYRQIYYCR